VVLSLSAASSASANSILVRRRTEAATAVPTLPIILTIAVSNFLRYNSGNVIFISGGLKKRRKSGEKADRVLSALLSHRPERAALYPPV
jgi:hypothetical protein